MTQETKNMQARIPADLHTWLKMEALRQGVSLQDLVERTLQALKDNSEPAGEFCACADPDCKGDHR